MSLRRLENELLRRLAEQLEGDTVALSATVFLDATPAVVRYAVEWQGGEGYKQAEMTVCLYRHCGHAACAAYPQVGDLADRLVALWATGARRVGDLVELDSRRAREAAGFVLVDEIADGGGVWRVYPWVFDARPEGRVGVVLGAEVER